MAETTEKKQGSRSTKIGRVTSTKMSKTIVVQVIMKKAHPLYRRVVAKSKKFYAHDEKNTAHVGDFVEIEETRPMSKLKRWRLKNVIQKAIILTDDDSISPQHLPENLQQPGLQVVGETPHPTSFEDQLHDYKIKLAHKAVADCHGNKTLAARSLHISRTYLHRLIKELLEEEAREVA